MKGHSVGENSCHVPYAQTLPLAGPQKRTHHYHFMNQYYLQIHVKYLSFRPQIRIPLNVHQRNTADEDNHRKNRNPTISLMERTTPNKSPVPICKSNALVRLRKQCGMGELKYVRFRRPDSAEFVFYK